jgi:hypothetical protein
MAEKNGLDAFDFSSVKKPGKFLKFKDGDTMTLRVLTKDPVVSEKDFGNGGVARLNFIVYNFTEERAQIFSASFGVGETLQRIGRDDDYGQNLQKVDVKISADGEQLQRVYTVNVLRHSGSEKELTTDQIKECATLANDLEDIEGNKGRLSEWQPPKPSSGYEEAKEQANSLRKEDDVTEFDANEPINLDDIPF